MAFRIRTDVVSSAVHSTRRAPPKRTHLNEDPCKQRVLFFHLADSEDHTYILHVPQLRLTQITRCIQIASGVTYIRTDTHAETNGTTTIIQKNLLLFEWKINIQTLIWLPMYARSNRIYIWRFRQNPHFAITRQKILNQILTIIHTCFCFSFIHCRKQPTTICHRTKRYRLPSKAFRRNSIGARPSFLPLVSINSPLLFVLFCN